MYNYKEYSKRYYEKNKEKIKEQKKLYYQKTKNRQKKYSKEYYQKIKKIKDKQQLIIFKNWFSNHKENYLTNQVKYHKKLDKNKINENAREYYKLNKDFMYSQYKLNKIRLENIHIPITINHYFITLYF